MAEFSARILQEAGEAIGNVGRRLFGRKRKREVDEALQRWMEKVPLPHIQAESGKEGKAGGDVIDATYRVIHDEQENENG